MLINLFIISTHILLFPLWIFQFFPFLVIHFLLIIHRYTGLLCSHQQMALTVVHLHSAATASFLWFFMYKLQNQLLRELIKFRPQKKQIHLFVIYFMCISHVNHPPWHTYKVHTEQYKVVPTRWLDRRSSWGAPVVRSRRPRRYDEQVLSSNATHIGGPLVWCSALRNSCRSLRDSPSGYWAPTRHSEELRCFEY